MFAKNTTVSDLPAVTVLIPMKNEQQHIGGCLRSVVDQDYPKDLLEVLVIDGMSDDTSRDIVQNVIAEYPFVRIIANPKETTATGLNLGITSARGEIIVRVDAHTVIDRDYIRCCVRSLEETGADNVGGLMRPEGRSFIQKAIATAMSSPFGIGSGKFHFSKDDGFVDTVYLGAFHRDVFERVGLYDEAANYGEDDELNYRIIESGGKIFLSQKIKSTYYPRSSMKLLWRQFFNYGYGKVRTFDIHNTFFSLRHLAPPSFVLFLLLGMVLSVIRPILVWPFLFGLGIYMASALAFSIYSGCRSGLGSVLVLPAIFATLHFSYGIGFILAGGRLLLSARQHRV